MPKSRVDRDGADLQRFGWAELTGSRRRYWQRLIAATPIVQADKRRDPIPFLTFAALRPGMKVLDMGAGGGYSTELLARAVAPGGIVYGRILWISRSGRRPPSKYD